MSTRALERIRYVPGEGKIEAIPWPKDLEPKPADPQPQQLPAADVLIVTYTYAEAQGLGEALSPGLRSTAWKRYADKFAEYEPHLTKDSPARETGYLGAWASISIGEKSVVLFKSELHLSTDDQSLPVRKLLQQIIATVTPTLLITTGTAGGIGDSDLGDILIADAVKFNCTKMFKDEPWAQTRYACPYVPAGGANLKHAFEELIPVNAKQLKPQAKGDPQLLSGDLETLDFFGFADPQDSFGVAANDPQARMLDMDDAVIPLALGELGGAGENVRWLSIRNTSDPQTPQLPSVAEEEKWAQGIYKEYGRVTSVGSAITCWAVIADS